MSVQYTAYKLTASDGSVLVDTNFQGDVSVKQSAIRQVLADLQNFSVGGKSENKSQLEVDADGQKFMITRDYKTNSLVVEPQPQPEAAQKLASWKNSFINVLQG